MDLNQCRIDMIMLLGLAYACVGSSPRDAGQQAHQGKAGSLSTWGVHPMNTALAFCFRPQGLGQQERRGHLLRTHLSYQRRLESGAELPALVLWEGMQNDLQAP